jgi:hypothetical protein
MQLHELRPLRSSTLVEKWYHVNDGSRTLLESIVAPEVEKAVKDFRANGGTHNAVLIGGLALSYHGIPRATMDADFLFMTTGDLPHFVEGFKRVSDHRFVHKETHVEVEVIDPAFINLPHEIAQEVFDSAIVSDGIRIASPSGIIALKLFRLKRYDRGDIEQLIEKGNIDLAPFKLPQELLDKYDAIVKEM